MAALRSALFLLLFYGGSIFYVLAAIVGAAIGREPLIAVTHGWARHHRRCAALSLGIRSRVEGRFPDSPALIVAKHQSNFETVEFLLLLKRPTVMLKRELADIPGWGWVAQRYGAVRVDRDGGAAALRLMLTEARAAVADGRSIVIFPEGTRVLPGEQPPLQSGFAGIYKLLGLPIIPVALDSGRLWPRNTFVKRPGTVHFRVGETIPPGLPRAEVEMRVHAAINALDSGQDVAKSSARA